ncbi:MAG: hypothetical protein KDI71_13335 [Xanthomonadales bacterium]|nr:hypothetical protein [Xanthomonadales bacterium]
MRRHQSVLFGLWFSLLPGVAAAQANWDQQAMPLANLGRFSPAAIDGVAVRLTGGPPERAGRWQLPPFAGGLREWETKQLHGSVDADFRWHGVALGEPDAQAVIVRRGRALSGMISTPEGVFELIPAADGNYLVKLDSSRFPACAGGVEAESGGEAASNTSAPVPEGSTVIIDVLVVYTPEARDGAGGVNQIEAVAQAAVDNANLSFSNAQSTPRLRLVDARLANYNDTGVSSNDLSWVRNDPEVAAWRNEVGADMVGLITNDLDACGRGYVMRNPGPGFAGSAFQVTARGCAVGNLSYAHEHGHNMGMEHDPANGTSPGSASYPFAFGHFVSGSYRTVMSYSSECTGGCTRRPYFSNPEVIFMGVPTGIADERNNAQTGINVAAIVAAFRPDAGLLFDDGFE